MSFEDVMMKRLASCHSEACDEILAGVKSGRSLSDAVSDTIEALPASKSRDLRRWLEDWETWEAWLAFKKKGWHIRSPGKGIVVLSSPLNGGFPSSTVAMPSGPMVAAAAGVRSVKYARGGWERNEDSRGRVRYDCVYEVVK